MAGQSVYWRQFTLDRTPLEHERAWPPQPYTLPLPNAALREASSVSAMDAFFAIGEAWGQLVSHFLSPAPLVLDIGCGCGKLARFLYLNPSLRYVGVDLYLPAIQWCRAAFSDLAGDRFRFEHFDGYSSVYNPEGKVKASEYVLPCAGGSVDMVVCASLFTHLLLPDCEHYLSEIHRVIKPGGRAMISIHTEPAAGQLFSGDETRIDIEPSYFLSMAGNTGLRMSHEIGKVYGQFVFLFERDR